MDPKNSNYRSDSQGGNPRYRMYGTYCRGFGSRKSGRSAGT